MILRFRNQFVDVEIEGDDEQDCWQQFLNDYPDQALNAVKIEQIEDRTQP